MLQEQPAPSDYSRPAGPGAAAVSSSEATATRIVRHWFVESQC